MKIEKNIPIPAKGKARTSKWEILEVGDSILFEDIKKASSTVCCIIQWSRRNNMDWKMAQRKVAGGTRIWRIK